MNLPDFEIDLLCHEGMVEPYDPALLNPASLDVRLGDELLIESAATPELLPYPFADHSQQNPYMLAPGQFVLARTLEYVRIPDSIDAQFVLKSSRAREGIEHLLAGYIDPQFEGVITLELHNSRQLHSVPIWPGMKIGQLKFSTLLARPKRGYAQTGRYHQAQTVEASKG
jgi:dCTP deaminase